MKRWPSKAFRHKHSKQPNTEGQSSITVTLFFLCSSSNFIAQAISYASKFTNGMGFVGYIIMEIHGFILHVLW